MDTQRIAELVAELEKIIPKSGGRVLLVQYADGDRSKIVANTIGYLRLALIFLKAAFMPESKGKDAAIIEFELDQITEPDSSINFSKLERTEDVHAYIHKHTWDISAGMVVFFIYAVFLMGMCVVGLVTTARFLLSI